MDAKDFMLDVRQMVTNSGKGWATLGQITYTPTRDYVTRSWVTDAPEQGYYMARAWFLAIVAGREGEPGEQNDASFDGDGWTQLPLP
jgi:hypothetical protein